MTIDEMQDILDELADELPDGMFEKLNGGILLLPEARVSPHARGDDLYILGEYRTDPNMGCYIVIFYGSFMKVFAHADENRMKNELRHTLRHEFRHHFERLGGTDELGKEDSEFIKKYLAGA